MQRLLDQLIRGQGLDPARWPFTEWVYAIAMLVAGLVAVLFGAVVAGVFSWLERKIAARMQSRIGPNRVGPQGFLQWVADGLKLFFKEDLIPAEADRWLFRLAPYFILTGFVLTFVALPFSHGIVAAEMNVGLFYIMAITALVVVGILMGGWGSNSKWSLFGGIRSAAQVVSYEIPTGLVILVPVLMAGSLSMQGIIGFQGGVQAGSWYEVGGWPWNWVMFANPMAFVGFFIFFTSSLAEGNRTPFDLPEAESELVAGYFTEYSGFRFAYLFVVEFGNLWVMAALATALFLGGWEIPGVTHEALARSGWLEALSLLVFALKTLTLVSVIIWVRWTLPRIRVDQMMALCWKYLVPLAMLLVVLAAANEWLLGGASPHFLLTCHLLFFVAAGVLPLVFFARQTFKNIELMGDRVDMGNW